MTPSFHKTLFVIFACLTLALPLHAQEDEEEAAAEETEETEEQEPKITDYIEMSPAFVTHVGPAEGKLVYLKASVTLRASTETARPAIEAHMPRLRHELVMLFGEKTDADALASYEGQTALREEAKARINAVLEEQQTSEEVTDVLFTEFVVQR